ncbi:MAG: hypothetical protein MJY45_00580 [Bacteroidales bacterium]|nr:hypothetical protein [Bacteroidales bacterium]
MSEKKNILKIVAGILKSMYEGKLLLRIKADRLFPQIAFTFMLIFVTILVNIVVENNLAVMQDNKSLLGELEITCTQKKYELITLGRRSTVGKMLEDMNSEVGEPTVPAVIIK